MAGNASGVDISTSGSDDSGGSTGSGGGTSLRLGRCPSALLYWARASSQALERKWSFPSCFSRSASCRTSVEYNPDNKMSRLEVYDVGSVSFCLVINRIFCRHDGLDRREACLIVSLIEFEIASKDVRKIRTTTSVQGGVVQAKKKNNNRDSIYKTV